MSAVSWWCTNKEASRLRGTNIPGIVNCPYYEYNEQGQKWLAAFLQKESSSDMSDYETRVIRRFLWRPLRLYNGWRWLQWAWIEERNWVVCGESIWLPEVFTVPPRPFPDEEWLRPGEQVKGGWSEESPQPEPPPTTTDSLEQVITEAEEKLREGECEEKNPDTDTLWGSDSPKKAASHSSPGQPPCERPEPAPRPREASIQPGKILPKIDRATAIEIRPGDTVVLEVLGKISSAQRDMIYRDVREWINCEALILSNGLRLVGVKRKEEAEDSDPPILHRHQSPAVSSLDSPGKDSKT